MIESRVDLQPSCIQFPFYWQDKKCVVPTLFGLTSDSDCNLVISGAHACFKSISMQYQEGFSLKHSGYLSNRALAEISGN